MESGEGAHMMQAWKQAVNRGNTLDTRHVRRKLGIHKLETTGGEQSCFVVKERVIS